MGVYGYTVVKPLLHIVNFRKLRLPLGEKLEWMKNESWREESNKRRGKQEEWRGKWNKDGITKSDTVTLIILSHDVQH